MPTITTRAGKDSDLTHNELDANFKRTVTPVTGTYQVLVSDNRSTIEGNHATIDFTVTLPEVANALAEDTGDFSVRITNINAATVSVDGFGSEAIDGSTDAVLLQQWDAVTVALNAAQTGWKILSRAKYNNLIPWDSVSVSGATVEFTGIPAWARRITLVVGGLSISTTNDILIQLGYSGGYATTNYYNLVTQLKSTGNTLKENNSGFQFYETSIAADNYYGVHTFVRGALDTNDIWLWTGTTNREDAAGMCVGSGKVAVAGTVTKIKMVIDGAGSFDGGSVKAYYE